MPVQDDEREIELVRIFNLEVAEDRVRDGIDANLLVDEVAIEFELKSTSGTSISTVRDFGPDHIKKWKNLHWIFGFYNNQGNKLLYSIYASPDDMRPWIEAMRDYVAPDFLLAHHAPELVSEEMMHEILGEQKEYDLEDARRIHKRQYTMDQYRQMMDLREGFTPDRMLLVAQEVLDHSDGIDMAWMFDQLGEKDQYSLADARKLLGKKLTIPQYWERMDCKAGYTSDQMLAILQDRCRYLIERGSTLNNPHIPGKYFDDFDRITTDHANQLRIKIRAWLDKTSPSEA